VASSASSQPGCGTVSLLRKTSTSPRASDAPSLQAAMKPPLVARACRWRPSICAQLRQCRRREASSTTITSNAAAGGCAAIARRQARVCAKAPYTGITMLARGVADVGITNGENAVAGGAYSACAGRGLRRTCRNSPAQLAASPRVRRLAQPRRHRPSARAIQKRASAGRGMRRNSG
jgi:hypothetical protein